jgi:hypothetical protein
MLNHKGDKQTKRRVEVSVDLRKKFSQEETEETEWRQGGGIAGNQSVENLSLLPQFTPVKKPRCLGPETGGRQFSQDLLGASVSSESAQ